MKLNELLETEEIWWLLEAEGEPKRFTGIRAALSQAFKLADIPTQPDIPVTNLPAVITKQLQVTGTKLPRRKFIIDIASLIGSKFTPLNLFQVAAGQVVKITTL